MITYDIFICILIYIGSIIALSVLFYFLPKYKNPYGYVFWCDFIFKLPFITGLLFFNFHSSCPSLARLFFYMLLFNAGAWLYGFLYYYLYVRRQLKQP